MYNDNYSDIKQIAVRSEKEFIKLFDELSASLIDTNLDWNKRLNAIKKIEGLILGGAYELPCFSAVITKFHANLTVQLNDLRSTISREAARLTCLLAEKCGEVIEGLCEKLVMKESLLKLINNGNKLLAETGHQCILALIVYVQSGKILPRLLEEIQSKNVFVRARIAEYLVKIFEVYPENTLEKHMAVLENALVLGVSDASQETRAFSRNAFKLYTKEFAARAQRLFVKLDPSAQKTLNEEGVNINYKPDILEKLLKGNSNNEDSASTVASRRSVTPKRESKASFASTQEFMQNKLKKDLSRNDLDRSTDEPSMVMNRSYHSIGTKVESTKNRNISTDRFAKDPQAALRQVLTTRNRDASPLNKNTRAMNTSMVNTQRERTSEKKRPPSAMTRGARDTSQRRIETLNNTHNSSFTNKNLNHSRGEMSFEAMNTSSRSPMRRTTTEPDHLKKGTLGKKVPGRVTDFPRREQVNPSTNSIVEQKVQSQMLALHKEKMNFYKHMKEEDLSFLLESCKDENWATRFHAFEKIGEIINDMDAEEDMNPNLLSELIKIHIQKINDPHIKVSVACMSCFARLVAIYPKKIKQQMNNLLPVLIECLTDSKEKVSAGANAIMTALAKVFTADELIEPYLQTLEKLKKSKTKITLLEIISVAVPNCDQYFENHYNIRQIVQKSAIVIAEGSSSRQFILSGLDILTKLSQRYFQPLMTAFFELPTTLQASIRSNACQHAIDLEQRIREYIQMKTDPSIRQKKKRLSDANNLEVATGGHESGNLNNQLNDRKNLRSLEEDTVKNKQSFQGFPAETPKRTNGNPLRYSDSDDIPSYLQNENPRSHSPVPTQGLKYHKAPEPFYENKTDAAKQVHLIENTEEPYEVEGSSPFNKPTQRPSQSEKPGPKANKTYSSFLDLNSLEYLVSHYKETKEIWDQQAEQIIESVFAMIKSSGAKTSDLVIQLLRVIFELPLNFAALCQKIVIGLTELLRVIPKNSSVEELWTKLMSKKIKDVLLGHLIDAIGKEDHPVLQVLIKYSGLLFYDLPSNKSKTHLPSLFSKFKELINHTNPDVRKVVVFNIVDLYFIFGEELAKYIEEFSTSQQKLISIYIKRKLEKNNMKQ